MLNERETREISIEVKDIIDDELRLHPDVKTVGDKIANIWGILGLTKEIELAQILGVSESNIPMLFDENKDIGKPLENEIDQLFAISAILGKKVEDLSRREKFLREGNSLLKNQSPMQYLKRGRATEVLLLVYGQTG